MPGNGKEGGRSPLAVAGMMLSLGACLACSSLGGLYLGTLLDRSRATSAFAPAGLLVGLLVGFQGAYLLARAAIDKRK